MSAELTTGARDVRLLERAIRCGWDIPQIAFKNVPLYLLQIIQDKTASHRSRIMAVRALTQLNAQNIEISKPAIEENHNHLHLHGSELPPVEQRRDRMAALAERLGLGAILAEPAIASASEHAEGIAVLPDAC